MFDQEPAPPLHGECAEEIETLNAMLHHAKTELAKAMRGMEVLNECLGASSDREVALRTRLRDGETDKWIDLYTAEKIRADAAEKELATIGEERETFRLKHRLANEGWGEAVKELAEAKKELDIQRVEISILKRGISAGEEKLKEAEKHEG